MIDSPLWKTHRSGILAVMAKRPKPPRDVVARLPVDVVRFRRALGRVIAEIREGMELTQEQFADRLQLDQTTVAKAETGIHLWRLETWLMVSQSLKIPFHELFRRAAERDSPQGKTAMNRVVEALEPSEQRLIQVWRQLTPEGRQVLVERAEACLQIYRTGDNIVPLVHTKASRRQN